MHPDWPDIRDIQIRDDINWRVKHRGANVPYFQPACLTRLDTAVERYRVPAPHHLRLSASASPLAVLQGAPSTLGGVSLKSICLHLTVDEPQVLEALAAFRWMLQSRREAAAGVPIGSGACRLRVTDVPFPRRLAIRLQSVRVSAPTQVSATPHRQARRVVWTPDRIPGS